MSIYNHYYVYAYLRQDGTPYYIGKGKNKRAFSQHHRISVPNDKTRIVFLEKNLTEIGALALERRYISWYGRKDLDTGILRNMTDGGDGGNGYKHTQKHKKYMSSIHKGKKISNDTRRKISETLKGRKMLPHVKEILKISNSKKKTYEHRKKISLSHMGIKHNSKTKELLSIKNSKGTYRIISPNGIVFDHHSLRTFSKQHNLSAFLLYKFVNNGAIKTKKSGLLNETGRNSIDWKVYLHHSSS